MTELQLLQAYWWLLISVLGAALVFMLFVQGGQSMLFCHRGNETHLQLMINSLGRKWELSFTSLVVFGGAFFASFPLFYSTSFGGAYWLWLAILISFVIQAFSYEFRRKKGNLYGTATYDICLLLNGVFGCILLGVAVGTLFFGGEFEITRTSLLDAGSPVISRWAPTRGLEALACWQCLLLGVAVFFLARTQAAMYFINNIDADRDFDKRMRRATLINGTIFALLFVVFVVVLFTTTGRRADASGLIVDEPYLYLTNMLDMWWWGVIFAAGVVLVLTGILLTAFTSTRKGIWLSGSGTILVVVALLAVAAYGNTAYLPSNTHPQSSLTLANSSSSLFTLKVMSWVSVLVPFVLAYIWYVWSKMNRGGISSKDLADGHTY